MRAIGMLAVAALATFALRRTGYRPPMIAGFAATAIGTALLAFPVAGGITGISIASALVARSSNPGLTQAAMFTVLAVIMVLLIPLIFLVPDHRGT